LASNPKIAKDVKVCYNIFMSEKRKIVEFPRLVQVEIGGSIYAGSMYIKDTVSCRLLTRRPMPQGYELIEHIPYTRMVCIMEDGTSAHIMVVNPQETDNGSRTYALTSRQIQEQAINTSSSTNAYEIPRELITEIELKPGEPLVVPISEGQYLKSNSNISAVVCIDIGKGPLDSRVVEPDKFVTI
jgi:hypothetical protein